MIFFQQKHTSCTHVRMAISKYDPPYTVHMQKEDMQMSIIYISLESLNMPLSSEMLLTSIQRAWLWLIFIC